MFAITFATLDDPRKVADLPPDDKTRIALLLATIRQRRLGLFHELADIMQDPHIPRSARKWNNAGADAPWHFSRIISHA